MTLIATHTSVDRGVLALRVGDERDLCVEASTTNRLRDGRRETATDCLGFDYRTKRIIAAVIIPDELSYH
jgi:hypothetical protein